MSTTSTESRTVIKMLELVHRTFKETYPKVVRVTINDDKFILQYSPAFNWIDVLDGETGHVLIQLIYDDTALFLFDVVDKSFNVNKIYNEQDTISIE